MQAIEVFPSIDNEANLQLNADGSLRHLLTLKGLDRSLLLELLDDAERFVGAFGSKATRSQSLAGHTVANLFFEPSTRTRASFDLAGKRLGADEYFANYGISEERMEGAPPVQSLCIRAR
jgi:aspartate carbamoyltransferase catalytic subunit